MSKYQNYKLLRAFKSGICMQCGDSVKALHLHHINHDSRDDRMNNLILYCRKCHTAHHVVNGKSRVVPTYLHRIKGGRLPQTKFNIKYADKGGVKTLIDMAVNQKLTLQKMGDHFGVTREYIRQLLNIYGIRKGKFRGGKYEIEIREGTVERKMKNLYKWIIDHDMLIGEFSVKSGIASTRLSCILTGKVTPNYEDLSKIKEVTGMSFEDILAEEKNGKGHTA